ncbi:MAG TPA: 30S ribosomal protein S17 [Bacillota bacterium]|jgi:small subunit ribosomal protein S17|nr:30S ribosomal protein S17 [Bacillota bacterium]HOK64323.1 30S ribosomal protein S17 [Bacillota bacterium]HOL11924.1 30S ribosomal protein S17 [Bacillota bacterium]HOQ03037.1 30S ribosomal protein S17 [Bacillota bacterium]HPP60631.1 30S ribosomal protein S17 [Bacillota bacterium]
MEQRGKRRKMMGVVVSDKMDKTRVVAVDTWKVHPLYGKRMKSTKKVQAHDEENITSVGDKVLIVETRPLSKHKRWTIAEVLETSNRPVGGDRT